MYPGFLGGAHWLLTHAWSWEMPQDTSKIPKFGRERSEVAELHLGCAVDIHLVGLVSETGILSLPLVQ